MDGRTGVVHEPGQRQLRRSGRRRRSSRSPRRRRPCTRPARATMARAQPVRPGSDDDRIDHAVTALSDRPEAHDCAERCRVLALPLAVRTGAGRSSISWRFSAPRSSSCRCSASTASSRSAAGSAQRAVPRFAQPLLSRAERQRLSRAPHGWASRCRVLALSAWPQRWARSPRRACGRACGCSISRSSTSARRSTASAGRSLLCEVGFFTIFAGAGRTQPSTWLDLDLALDPVPADVRRRPDQDARRHRAGAT